jgi:hypothetical protein
VAITFFNWSEIWILSKRDLASIICLTYAQSKDYNELSAKTMMNRLKLDHIPPELFHHKVFTQYKHTLVCNYKTKDPQNYFNNSSFLYTNTSAKHKAVYIKALGLRKFTSDKNYIPLKYFPNVTYNPFLTVNDDNIYFPLESSV